eukprot:TRINITY_DN68239_c0_g1_i1.p1 TRINITY_DN68239_c0_g1~~TRINITY_DN68239_c0_g1_i1.p1  ORF type:complete len:622 (+),score=96.94 TRINITY_DN68239_c0_g1_i1:62-1867(+)
MASVGLGSDHAPFFSSLPPNDLLPAESSLRQSLLDWLHQKPGPFPLIEWIDRRIGGEVETRRDPRGLYEILLRGTAGPPVPHMPLRMPPHHGMVPPNAAAAGHGNFVPRTQPQAGVTPMGPSRDFATFRNDFFDDLPNDRFSTEEVQLREAVFEFLASWKSKELATLRDLHDFPSVHRHTSSLLPRGVALQDWIEKRIGGEVELRPGKKGGDQIVCLTMEGKRLVREKYEQMSQGVAPAVTEPTSKDAFFSSLPSDELLPEEITLWQDIIAFLQKWAKQKPKTYPSLTELSADAKVKTSRDVLLPPKIKLRAWIERRIGGEIELRRSSPTGEHLVMFRGSPPLPAVAAVEANPRGVVEEKAPVTKNTPARQFFADLPEDELSEAEQNLRAAVLDVLVGKESSPPLLVEVCRMFQKDPVLARTKAALLPSEVSLQMWVNRRIGGEVEITKSPEGRQIMRLRSEGSSAEASLAVESRVHNAGGHGTDDEMDRFFSTLPSDEFTQAEASLREALLSFLGKWRKPQPPTVQQAKGDRDVARISSGLLPRGCPVDLGSWVQRRIGGEIEVSGPSGCDSNLKTLRLVGDDPPRQAADSAGAKKRKML